MCQQWKESIDFTCGKCGRPLYYKSYKKRRDVKNDWTHVLICLNCGEDPNNFGVQLNKTFLCKEYDESI